MTRLTPSKATSPSPRRGGRGLAARLSRSFALLAGALLLIVGVVLTVLSYEAQMEQLTIRQQKTADEAVLVASAYLVRAQDMLWTYGHASSVHSLLLRSLDVQQKQLQAIIAQYPDVFQELTLLDDQGQEMARVSGSYAYPAQELGSWAGSPALEQTRQGRVYVAGQVRVPAPAAAGSTGAGTFNPTILIAVPLTQQYGRSGTLAADVSVKGMWDAIAGVEVGETGYSYIVDRDTGQIVAHSNLNLFLVLEGQTLERVSIVSRLMAVQQNVPIEPKTLPHAYAGLSSERVIGAVAQFPNTPWAMIVELPVDEAMAGLRRMVVLLALLVILGVLVAGGLGLIVPRRLVRPLLELQRGAQALGEGNLDAHLVRIDVPRRAGDELQDLAESLFQMAANLRTSRDELERRGAELEARVAERTRELTEISARTERRALQLQTSAEVARAIVSIRDLDELLPQVVEAISQRFGWYHAGIFLLEDAPSLAGNAGGQSSGSGGRGGKVAVLHAASSEGGRRMMARGHRIPLALPATAQEAVLRTAQEAHRPAPSRCDGVGNATASGVLRTAQEAVLRRASGAGEQGIVGTVAAGGEARIAPLHLLTPDVTLAGATQDGVDVGHPVGATYLPTAELHGTRSEMALPLSAGDPPAVIGVLDVQSLEPGAYDDEDVALLSSLADQVAIAIENARLFRETQRMLEEVRTLHRQVVGQEWERVVAASEQEELAYDFRGPGAPAEPDPVHRGSTVPHRPDGPASGIVRRREDLWPPELLAALGQGEPVAVPHRPAPSQHCACAPVQVWSGVGNATASGGAGEQGLASGGYRQGSEPPTPHRQGSGPPAPHGSHSALAAPIKVRGQVIGGLDLQDVDPGRQWTADEISLVQSIADQAGLALENARLLADTRRRAGQLATLHRVGLDITSALDLDGVLQALYQQTCNIVDVSLLTVALYDRESGRIEYPLVVGGGGAGIGESGIGELEGGGMGLAGYVIERGQPVRIADLSAPPPDLEGWRLWPAEEATRAYAGIPLVFREEVFGVLSVHSGRPGAYSEEDVELLTTMSTQAAIAIQNARAYRQLMDTAEQLREVDRLKTQFLANMSHELRTPLNSIIGFSRVILKGIDGPLTELQEADLSSIYNSGQHLLGLINSILDMSKIEAGKMELAFEEVRLAQILDTAVSTTRALIKDRPIELKVEVPGELPTVRADPQRVRQILINLLSNAAKFTEEGGITLTLQVKGSATRGEYVLVSVADTGVGMDAQAQQRLFVPFQQVDASTTRRAGGTGLGLAISRSFVQMHGGEIWVESEPGQGSTFHFTLPMAAPEPVPGTQVSEGMLSPGEDQPDKALVLAVDDDPGVITLLKRYLESDGYQVVGLLDSTAALDVARSLAARPAGGGALVAITLDVLMSRMDGWQVLEELKADPETAGVPVILCSVVEGLERGLGMGAAACVQKPFTRDELLAVLARVRART